MKKRKLLPVLLVLLLLLLAAGAALLFAGGGQDSGSGVDESVKPSPLLLQASQNRFRVYKGAQIELTVTSREVTEGTVTITDDLGETVLILELKDGTATGTIGVFEESPRCIQLTASMGEAKSQPLNLYVAPEVTAEMIQTGFQVAQELGDYLIDRGFNTVDTDAVAVAQTWLEQDVRVEAIVPMDNGVFYYTTDGIAGSCTLSPEPDTFGSTLFTQEQNDTLLTYAARSAGNTEYQYLWSDNTLTNDKILVLRPLYCEDGTLWKNFASDPCYQNDTFDEVVARIKDVLPASEEVCNDLSAVTKLTSGTINEYGIILLNTHGQIFGAKDTPLEQKVFCFMLQTGTTFHSLDETYKNDYQSYLAETLCIQPKDYDMFFTKYSEDAAHNVGTSLIFINVDLGVSAAEAEEAVTGDDVVTGVQLYGTGNLLSLIYQGKMFDNSIVCFSTCYSMANTKVAQFMIDHGAVAYVGFINAVEKHTENKSCIKLFDHLMTQASGKSRLQNVQESCDEAGLLVWRPIVWAGRSLWNLLPNIGPIGDLESNQWNMSAVANPADYTLNGTGSLTGTVQMDQTGEPVGGALVELYRWLDQEFILMGTTSTTGKGTFKVEDIPWGVYVAKVTTEEGAPAYANCILAAEKWDAGTILVEGISPYYIYIRDELEPKLGLFELGEKSQEIYDFNAQGWDMRTGILSAAIQDMNADGTDDMVLLRVELEDRKGWNLQTLYADMYTMEKGKVVLKDSVKLDVFNNCKNHDTWAAMYDTGEGYDLFVQSYSESVLTSGNDPVYARYSFDGEGLRKVFHIEQTEGGTTEKVYSGTKYNAETGRDETATLWTDMMLWDFIGQGLYNSWGYEDVPSMYWDYLEENMGMKAPSNVYGYPSYIAAAEFAPVVEFKNSGVPVGGLGGDFTMTVWDQTNLPGALESLGE